MLVFSENRAYNKKLVQRVSQYFDGVRADCKQLTEVRRAETYMNNAESREMKFVRLEPHGLEIFLIGNSTSDLCWL